MYHKKRYRKLNALLCMLIGTSLLSSPVQTAANHRNSEIIPVAEINYATNLPSAMREPENLLLPTGSVTIQNNNFEGNADYGLNSDIAVNAENNWWNDVDGPTHASNPQGSGDAVSDNVDFDPWLTSAVNIGIVHPSYPQPGIITLAQNNFEDNDTYGVESSIPITVENNWWGDATGPYHPTLNPEGQGDNASDNVEFDPWLTSAVVIGVLHPPSPQPGIITLSQNAFEDNSTYGVESLIPITAEYNWWGDVTGPYHPTLNPDGQGDNVSDNVDFDPWLTFPPSPGEPPILHVSPTTLDFGDTASYLTFEIQNIGPGTLHWMISENTSWLGATSFSGMTSGDGSYNGQGNETIGVVVGRMGLADNTYTTSIQVTSNGGSVSIPVTMTVESPGVGAANSELNVDWGLIFANGTETAMVTVIVRDLFNNPMSGKSVQLVSSRGAADMITPISTETDSNGQFLATVASSTAGESEISAIVQPEGIEINQSVQIVFYSGQGVDTLLTGWWLQKQINGLDDVLDTAETVAQDGDDFIDKVNEDQVELVVDSIFGAVSVIMPLLHVSNVGDAAQVSHMGTPMNWAHISHQGVPILDPSVTGRALEHLSTQVTPDTYRAVGQTLMQNNAEYWADIAAEAAWEVIRDAEQEVFTRWLKSLLQDPDAFEEVMYPHNQTIVNGYQVSLEDYATAVANSLPPLTSDEATAYRRDLVARNSASIILIAHLESAAIPLHQSRLEREWDEAHWYIAWLKIGAKITIPILVNIAFDSPAWFITTVVMTNATFAGWEIYDDVSNFSLDLEMVKLAFDLQTHMVPDTADRIFRNAARGVYLIDHELTPKTAKGQIVSTRDVSMGHYKLFDGIKWSEDVSYSEVTVKNTGEHETRYVAYATGSTDHETFVSEGVVKVQPGQTEVLRIPWKDASHGESPESVWIGVVGISDTGAYFIASTKWDFDPVRVEQADIDASHDLEAHSTTSALIFENSPQILTIPNPISSRMLGQRTSLNTTHYILAENPFTSTITVNMTQEIPAGVTVVDPGTLNLGTDSVSQQTTITPTGIVSFTYELRYDAAVGSEVEMPPTRLTVVDDSGSPLVTFDGNIVTLVSQSPLIVDGGPPFEVPQGVATAMPLTVTNLSGSSINGSVVVQVKTTSGTVIFDQSSPFSVGGQNSQRVDMSVSIVEPPGQYIISSTINYNAHSEQVFERFIRVGEPGGHRVFLPLVLKGD